MALEAETLLPSNSAKCQCEMDFTKKQHGQGIAPAVWTDYNHEVARVVGNQIAPQD